MSEEDYIFYIENLKKRLSEPDSEELFKKLAEKIEEEQQKVFMDGYRYAIKVLEEGMVK